MSDPDIDTGVLPTPDEIELLKKFKAYRPGRKCGDCGAVPGARHTPGCDVERCSICKKQALSGCVHTWALAYDQDPDNPDMVDPDYSGFTKEDYEGVERHNPGSERWTGVWPGVLECIKLGFFCWENFGRKDPNYPWWNPCGPEHPDAMPDLNRLAEHHAKLYGWD
jgi:hypothetical protein